MVTRTLFRGDDYLEKRPVYTYELIDTIKSEEMGEPQPYNMKNCTIRATFKGEKTDPIADPDDEGAPIKAEITFNNDGDIVGEPAYFALPTGMTAEDGVLHLRLNKSQTLAMDLEPTLQSDVQITDADGEDHTVEMLGILTTKDGFTNRSGPPQ